MHKLAIFGTTGTTIRYRNIQFIPPYSLANNRHRASSRDSETGVPAEIAHSRGSEPFGAAPYDESPITACIRHNSRVATASGAV